MTTFFYFIFVIKRQRCPLLRVHMSVNFPFRIMRIFLIWSKSATLFYSRINAKKKKKSGKVSQSNKFRGHMWKKPNITKLDMKLNTYLLIIKKKKRADKVHGVAKLMLSLLRLVIRYDSYLSIVSSRYDTMHVYASLPSLYYWQFNLLYQFISSFLFPPNLWDIK